MPFFSIITITKDNLSGLKATHHSLQEQDFSGYEWLVQDGHSRDGTIFYLQETDAYWRSEADHSLYDAMNRAKTRAGGDYLIFLNAGDALAAPDVLSSIRTGIEQSHAPADFIYGDSYEEMPGGELRYKKARPHTRIARGMVAHHQAMIYRRALLENLEYDTSFEIAADYDLTLRALQKAQHILALDFAVCRFSSGGLSQRKAALGRAEERRIRRNLNIYTPPGRSIIAARQWLAGQIKYYLPRIYEQIIR